MPITIRHPAFDLTDLPPRWLAGSRIGTAFGNAGHVFIPLGERFFIDTVRSFRDRIDDPELRDRVRGFMGQEAVHERTHAQVWDRLRTHGVPIDRYVAFVEAVRRIEAHLPATFRLSVTAGLEHYTAAFGHAFLTEDLSSAIPDEMAALLAWHGLEELEHRDVAFDVLQAVDSRYVVRVAGFGFASLLLVVVPAAGTVLFSSADAGSGTGADGASSTHGSSGLPAMTRRFLRRAAGHVVRYLDPRFHPSQLQPPPEAARFTEVLASRDSRR